ncbi:hypothetical protein EMPS_02790 [Entomortierella parvispora]|uniref:Rho-GAP domain-containing protein n=1 Tax=Entomortierella parvispora TaxID=205924 RepID=A0A9P3H5G5_9FUNG|nr:hypothetical protein EMPS_02790 [Entomortierella parvispora]
MPSFLRRLTTIKGRSPPPSNNSLESGKRRSSTLVNSDGDKKTTAMAEELNRYSTSGHYSDASTSSSKSSKSSHSATPTLSSASSLSLPPSLSDFSPLSMSSSEPSWLQSPEVLSKQHFSNPAAAAVPSVADRRSKSSGDPGSDSLLIPPPGSLSDSHYRQSIHSSNANANANTSNSNNIHKNSHPPQSSSLEPNQNFQPPRQHQHPQQPGHSALSPISTGSLSTSNNNSSNSKGVNRASLPIRSSTLPSASSSGTEHQQQPEPLHMDTEKKKMKRASVNSLTVLFHPKSRSMPMLQEMSTSHLPRDYQPSHRRHPSAVLPPQPPFPPTSATSLSPVLISTALSSNQNSKNSNSLKRASLDSSVLLGVSQTTGDKKSRRKSLSNMLLQSDQQLPLSSSPQLSRSGRWAGRGGIGAKNEMMVDLETSGVFVPSSGKRLRAEFVYRAVIQCADEIRRRGLGHPNIFLNPSPKKVISAMISLMTDQVRSDLYTTECLRIDTVASLMLNLLSQMSNPVVPYAIMEYYFQQGNAPQLPPKRASTAPPSLPPLLDRSNSSGGARSTPSLPLSAPVPLSTFDTLGASLPIIPALPVLNGQSSPRAPSSSVLTWSREHFDLQMFLDALPAMNRVILLEVLHLCAEVLEYQMLNRLTLNRLVQQVAPALFSTVFDQKILEQMAGGSRRCSIHSDRISAEEGARAENHLFTVILVRFLQINARTRNQTNYNGNKTQLSDGEKEGCPTSEWSPSASTTSVLPTSVYGGSSTQFRKSQELLQLEQQEHYQKMALSFQEMEIQKDPRVQQHFGQYSASHRQQQKQPSKSQYPSTLNSAKTATTTNGCNVDNLAIKSSSAGSGSCSTDPNPSHILLAQPNRDPIQSHREHFWQSREALVGAGVAH